MFRSNVLTAQPRFCIGLAQVCRVFLGVPPLRIEQPPVAQGLHSNEPLTYLRILILDPTTSLSNKPTLE